MSSIQSEAVGFSVRDMQWKGITLTESAAKQIALLTKDKKLFHFSTKVSGCTGFAYDIKLIDKPSGEDLEFESHGCTFYVALHSMPMIDNTEIDFVNEGLNQTFVYHNPNEKNQCGCGKSFGV